jgi:DNA repair exonuclease SbcCD ATPase subunit
MSYDGPDISELEATENQLISNIENIEISINKLEDIITKMPKFDPVSTNELNLQKNQKDILNKDIKIVTKELTQLEQLIKLQQQKIDHLKTHEYDHTCKYCVSNIFVKEAEEAKIELPKNQKLADIAFTKQFELQTNRDIIQDTILKYQEQIDLSNKLEKFELQLQVLESDLQTKESELETTNERQELFKKNETAIIHNKSIDEKIKTKKNLIIDIVNTLKSITDKVKSNHGEIEVAKTKKKTALEQLETYKQLETEYKAYEYYLQSVKRDGVPYELIKKALPKIETEINNVLDQVVDFNMVLNTDGKNINGYIIYDEDNFWPLELTSGMERFMSSLAIRVALINVSALPRPNFIAIDEGWGSLDREHISAVTNLFEYFRTKFDFSIIISHVESMRDMVDNLIEVNKINNFSQIQHT